VNLGAGKANFSVADLHLDDYTNIPNSLSNGALIPTVPSAISFTVNWFGAQNHRQVNNPDPSFRVSGLFVDTSASITAAASNASGFSFTTDNGPQTAITAKLGHEQNGVFYNG
jgi:hypothetical protein